MQERMMPLKVTIKKDLGTGYLDRVPRLRQIAKQAVESRLKMGLPRVYRNELCKKPNQFIHEYADGRKFLIEQNQSDSSEEIIRKLS